MLQQLYRENKISLSMNSVFFTELNERLRHLDEDPSKVFTVTGSLKKSLLFDDHIDDNDNDFFSSPSHKSSQLCVKDELTQKYGFSNPSIELFSHETKKLSLKHEIVTCSSQFLLISNGDAPKQDPWGSSYESELRGFDKLDKRVAMKIVDNMSVASNRILNYKKKPSVNHDNPIKSLWSFIWNLAIEDLENAKRFLKYLCLDLNFPIECIEFEDEMGKSVLGQCLLQYLVFLCNEFQDGRLFNMSHDTTMQRRMDALPLLILSYGWDFPKQEKELPFIFKSNTKHSQHLLPYLLFQSQRYKHVDENYVFSLLLQKMLVSGWTDLDLILSYYLIENEEMIIHLFTTSDRRVQYSSTMTLPLFVSVLLRCNVNQKFVPKRLMEKMSAEQFHTMIGTHLDSNGDSILHLYLKSVGDDNYALLDGELVLSLIRKAPNLLLTRNNDGLTPKQMLLESCSPMSYYLVYLIKTEFAQYL
ncbi:hypothetical protein C9374_001755 [Naegleria lovaniensis]|uniref:Uncharacterized protein n=1 Tax=Naegleria lovaniensis TaxID=51637 RepID=A0AA88GW54_NAELO|nr:uncharacterized protein C9374_001755 [Naegleria lovaniensis]KAG2387423.1 hypothetical protein C9374_001755 [Naegleria lovaniensis]